MVERRLKRRHPVPHLLLDEDGDGNMSAPVAHDFPRSRLASVRETRRAGANLAQGVVLPSSGVNEGDIRPVGAVPGVGGCIDDSLRVAHSVVVDVRAKRAAKLPACIRGACERRPCAAAAAERHQLVLRAEVLLRDPANAFRCITHRAWKFSLTSVRPSAVVEHGSATGVDQTLDQCVGVLRRVIGL
jgi:hypothetical protein